MPFGFRRRQSEPPSPGSEALLRAQRYDEALAGAKAAVASAKAAVERAKLNLSYTTIVATIDGIVGIAKAQVGDLVGPGTGELATISTLDPGD